MKQLTTFLLICTAWGGSYGNPNTFSMFGYGDSNSIAVTQMDGKTQIVLNGKLIDLGKATVVQQDAYNVVLSPVEEPEAVITVSKVENGKLSIDYKGQHYETLRPQDMDNMIQANMAQMNQQMQQLRQQMQDMRNNMFNNFKNFPMGGMMGGMMGGLFD